MTSNKQSCPTCGQSVNIRKIKLGKHHVEAMFKVWKYLKIVERSSAKMSELRGTLSSIEYATFNEWRKFAPHAVFGKRGTYDFDMRYLDDIIKRGRVCIEIHVNPLEKTYTMAAYGTIKDAKNVSEFLDDQQQFIAEYTGSGEVEQTSLL